MVVGGTAPIDYQTYAHHIIAAATFYQTLYFMNWMVVFGVCLLFMEISTTYVAMRWLLYKHDLGRGPLYAINAVFLFITFLIGRLLYQFYVTFWVGAPLVYKEYEKKNITLYQGTVVAEMFIMVALSLVLNLYWFYLMVLMIYRLLSRIYASNEENTENI